MDSLQLEESKNMEAEERARLEAEINAKREEVGRTKTNHRTETCCKHSVTIYIIT